MSHSTDADAAERRLLALLDQLRAEAPHAAAGLVEDVLRTARWQRVVRGALLGVSALAGVLADAIAVELARPPAADEERR